ncbi:MAG: hypothetical protein KDD61_00755 [Bdellovibrionales bacterium]|nr:hypothetical protein [Bdellovibrionales bacterium]
MKMGILLIGFVLTLANCSTLTRSRASGYSDNYGQRSSSLDEFYQERESYDAGKARQNLGLSNSKILNESESERLFMQMKLTRLEQSIRSEKEKGQYYSFKPFLPSTQDKINFLQIPTYEGRQRWATSQGFIEKSTNHNPLVSKAIENKDVVLGMNKKAVVESWGEPDLVEVSGNPMYENERWLYKRLVSSNEGFENENRVIYFEFGRVAGWDRE